MPKPITVLVVDDSALIREMVGSMVASAPDMELVGTASDPYEAREKIKQVNPDVLTLDIEMPKMDGITFLEKIMTLRPMPVIMFSSLTQKGAEATIRALELGAVDYVSKPILSQTPETIGVLTEEILSKIRTAASANLGFYRADPGRQTIIPFNPPAGGTDKIIAIGSSTGGVEALREICIRLPANSPPIVITQHMPEGFTRSLAERLDGLSQICVSEAENHMRLRTGNAYIAPGGKHLKVVKVGSEFVCRIEDSSPVSGHKPSVDVLFTSLAESAGARAVGVILTGMGNDGAAGMKVMRECGAWNIGQNRASCVVYGMPMRAAQLGAVHLELPLASIPAAFLKFCEGKGDAA